MSDFRASDGTVIAPEYDLVYELQYDEKDIRALHEWSQAKRDEELGRWRWPENRDYVVYALPNDSVMILNERDPTFELLQFYRDHYSGEWPTYNEAQAAFDYFDAHPGTKLWANAKPGEVWLVEHAGTRFAVTVSSDGYWRSDDTELVPQDEDFTILRRIWPE